jgi:hypothetical protein
MEWAIIPPQNSLSTCPTARGVGTCPTETKKIRFVIRAQWDILTDMRTFRRTMSGNALWVVVRQVTFLLYGGQLKYIIR